MPIVLKKIDIDPGVITLINDVVAVNSVCGNGRLLWGDNADIDFDDDLLGYKLIDDAEILFGLLSPTIKVLFPKGGTVQYTEVT